MPIEQRASQQAEAEQTLRTALESVVEIAGQLRPLCTGIDDLIEMCQLGLRNDGQLRLILREVTQPDRK